MSREAEFQSLLYMIEFGAILHFLIAFKQCSERVIAICYEEIEMDVLGFVIDSFRFGTYEMGCS